MSVPSTTSDGATYPPQPAAAIAVSRIERRIFIAFPLPFVESSLWRCTAFVCHGSSAAKIGPCADADARTSLRLRSRGLHRLRRLPPRLVRGLDLRGQRRVDARVDQLLHRVSDLLVLLRASLCAVLREVALVDDSLQRCRVAP